MSVRETITRNTVFNAAGRSWDAIVALVLVAYIVARVGPYGYGLWAVVGAFTGYAALFDLGVGSAYAKYIAEHAARGEPRNISSIVSTGFFFYALFGGLFVAVLWPVVGAVLDAIPAGAPSATGDFGSAETRAELGYLVRGGLVLFAVSNCIAPFTALQTGLQRMGVTNAISVGASLVKVAATVAFLELDYGVRGLLYANAAVLAAFGIASAAAAFSVFPALRISPALVDHATFGRLFRFGWRAQVSRLANLVTFETDVLVIAIVLRDFELAGLYKLGVELANKFRQVPAILLSALVPAASDFDARDDRDRIRKLYLLSSKYVALVAVPLTALLLGAAALMMKSWQGTSVDFEVPATVLRVLAVGYLANTLAGAGVTVALGMGRPDLQMKAGLLAMSSNIVLTVTLVLTVGFWGIPAATTISMVLSWLWFSRVFGRLVGVPAREAFRQALVWPALAAGAGLGVCALGDWFAYGLDGRMLNLTALTLAAGAFIGVYLFVLRLTPFVDDRDIEYFDDTLGLRRVPGYVRWSRPMRNVRGDHG